MNTIVKFKNVTKSYQMGDQRVQALRSVSFEIPVASFCMIIALFFLSFISFPAYGKNTVGIIQGKLRDGLPYIVWYPSSSTLEENLIAIGNQKISGLENAPWLKGVHGLILISPGSGRTYLSYVRTAHFFASQNFIVASLNHRHDNAFDYSGSSSLAVFNNRPQEMSHLLDHFLNTPLRKHVDISKITAMGFSAGAYTALVMAGALPSTKALSTYCRLYPKPNAMCFQAHGFARITHLFSDQKLLSYPDRRIRSVIAITPPGNALFDKDAFHSVHIPVLLVEGAEDHVLIYPNNARYIKKNLAKKAQLITIKRGSHLSYLSFKPHSLPPLLKSEKNIASETIRITLERNILDFLIRTTHGDK